MNDVPQYTNYPPLSFVLLKGIGQDSIPAQVSVDSRFIYLSTHYLLGPIVAIPNLIDEFLGSQSDLIEINKKVYGDLLLKVKSLEDESKDSRYKLDDPLLIVRTFHHLTKAFKLKENDNLEISDSDLMEALKIAVEQDDLIKNAYHNMVNALNKISK